MWVYLGIIDMGLSHNLNSRQMVNVLFVSLQSQVKGAAQNKQHTHIGKHTTWTSSCARGSFCSSNSAAQQRGLRPTEISILQRVRQVVQGPSRAHTPKAQHRSVFWLSCPVSYNDPYSPANRWKSTGPSLEARCSGWGDANCVFADQSAATMRTSTGWLP